MSQPEVIKTQLRLPAGLHQRLVDWTGITGRSMNAEIVHRLEQSFESRPAPGGGLGLRAELAAQREINTATVEMLERAVTHLETMRNEDGAGPYPGQAAGKSVHEALRDTEEALTVFRKLVEGANLVLSEIAIAEATGAEMDVEDVRQYAKDCGLI